MSRLSEIFASRTRCFLPFVTAGHPDLETTLEILLQLSEAGSDIIELGVPFSDPIADGPIIQRSSFAALEHGYSMDDLLDVVRQFRKRSEAGLILMTYMNPIFSYGLNRLEKRASEIGLDGILVSDLTPEEYRRLDAFHRLDTIFLAAPTSSDQRLRAISESSRGFLYLVARTGVTGSQTDLSESVPATMRRIRQWTDLPVAVGFGITSRQDVEQVWEWAEGAVVGSAIVQFIEENRGAADLPARVGTLVRGLLPERPSGGPGHN